MITATHMGYVYITSLLFHFLFTLVYESVETVSNKHVFNIYC